MATNRSVRPSWRNGIINPKTRRAKKWKSHQQENLCWIITGPIHKKNTVKAYEALLSRFCQDFGEKSLDSLTSDQILEFLNKITEGTKQQTKRIRYSHLSAFFNFIRTNIEQDFQNPCDTPILRKMFRAKPIISWDIIEKDVIDEIIFKTDKPRNRLMLELMARGGMRVGERCWN